MTRAELGATYLRDYSTLCREAEELYESGAITAEQLDSMLDELADIEGDARREGL